MLYRTAARGGKTKQDMAIPPTRQPRMVAVVYVCMVHGLFLYYDGTPYNNNNSSPLRGSTTVSNGHDRGQERKRPLSLTMTDGRQKRTRNASY